MDISNASDKQPQPMDSSSPLVSIGMPLYNEAKHLRMALDHLLAQDYSNFEIVISDNASSDETASICQTYAQKDSRIHFHQNQSNLGAIANFTRVLQLSGGQYFLWASGHDLWHPFFLSLCVEKLNQHPSAVLCFPIAQSIDESGNVIKTLKAQNTQGVPPAQRFPQLLRKSDWYLVYGLMRKAALADIHQIQIDTVFLAELSLKGEFLLLPQIAFYLRTSPHKNYADAVGEMQRKLMPSSNHLWRERLIERFPFCLQMFQILGTARNHSLLPKEKTELFLRVLAGCLFRWKKELLNELVLWWLPRPLWRMLMEGIFRLHHRRLTAQASLSNSKKKSAGIRSSL